MQKLKPEVIAYAKGLEGQIPTYQISAATKKKFQNRLHRNSINNYLKPHKDCPNPDTCKECHPEYFNTAKSHKITRKQSIKSIAKKFIDSFNDDDPRLEQIVHNIMLSEKVE